MNIELHVVAYNEARILPYVFRHYAPFCQKMICHDGESTDATAQIARDAGAEVRPWFTNGQINDLLLTKLKQEAWVGTQADWVIFVDADEFIYFPLGVELTLAAYDEARLAVIKTHGFEMLSDVYPTGDGQIYDEVKIGGRDDKWYGKPALFSPKRVKQMIFGAGAHDCKAILHDGNIIVNPPVPSVPPTYLLHFHHCESVELIGARYDANQKRFSDVNKKNGWGNFKPGLIHAREKRDAINKTLQRVFP